MTLAVREVDDAVQFAVKAVPGASRDRIAGCHGEALKVTVSAPPEGGRANARICELLAAKVGVPTRAVTVVGGTTSPRKVVQIVGLDAATLRDRLAL